MSQRTLKIAVGDGESLPSVISRAAALYGAANAVTFTRWFGASFLRVCSGSVADTEIMAQTLGLDPSDLLRRGIGHLGQTDDPSASNHARGILRRFSKWVCPACIRDDLQTRSGRSDLRPFGRLMWSFSHYTVCHRHQTSLIRLPALSWQFGDDFHMRIRQAPENVWAKPNDVQDPSNVNEYIAKRLASHSNPAASTTWLDQLPLVTALHLCEEVGQQSDSYKRTFHEDLADRDAAPRGFGMIAESEGAFRDVLRSLIEKRAPKRLFTPYNVYGPLSISFEKFPDRPGYEQVRSIMQEVGYELLPLGPDSDFFGPVIRKFHSVSTAAREFEIPVSRICKLLGITPPTAGENRKMPTLIDVTTLTELAPEIERARASSAKDVRRFQSMLHKEVAGTKLAPADLVRVDYAAERLWTEKPVIWALADEGYLPIFPGPTLKSPWRIRRTEFDVFLGNHISSRELRKRLNMSRAVRKGLSPDDFKPLIFKAVVGDDFYDRQDFLRRL